MTTSSTDSIRAFIAVRPSDAARAELLRVQRELKKRFTPTGLCSEASRAPSTFSGRIKWVDPETFHITLLFLGDIPQADVPDILEKMKVLTQFVPDIHVSLNEINLFEKSGALWVGIDPSPELFELQKRLSAALDLEPGRFHAHFTLGRIKKGRGGPLFVQSMQETLVEPILFRVGFIELVQSELLPDGACYTELGRAAL